LINDIKDVDSDKLHPIKKNRPFAKGEFSIISVFIIIIIFFMIALYFSFLAGNQTYYYILFYFIYSFAYTFFLKKISIIDIFFLSIFYCIRIFSSAQILNQNISIWLVLFSFIFFSYLSSLKRMSDLNSLTKKSFSHSCYTASDFALLKNLIPALMIFSAIILFNYVIISGNLIHSNIIGYVFILFFVIYNIFLIKEMFRKKINEDFVLFFLKNKVLLIGVFLFSLLIVFNFLFN
jgi:4-hydroxybenzoate polyprenyltransferase